MTALLIDVATSLGLVAISREGHLLAAKYFPAAFETSRLLFPTLDELMTEQNLTPSLLAYIAVGRGPGSYTGVRIAAAAAKAIGFAAARPLVAVSSLEAYVPASDYSGPFFAAIDAKIGGIYLAEGICRDGTATFISPDELVPLDVACQKITSNHLVVTPTRELLALRLPTATIIERKPSAEFLSSLAFAAFSRGQISRDGSIELAYLRRTQAEIENNSGKKG
jgi:tRNA threonylcarbamoyl adenosine modification protein YeaZ